MLDREWEYYDKYMNIMSRIQSMFESGEIDANITCTLHDKLDSYYLPLYNAFCEGKVVNNIPRSEAKKAGNYGKDRLTDEEDMKHYQKRLYSATTGSPLSYANRKLAQALAPTEYDKEQEKKRDIPGKKFKLTGKDVKKIADSKGKDLAKAVYKGAVRDTAYDVAKQQATTFGAGPGQVAGAAIGGALAGPAGAAVGGTTGQLTGISIGSLNQNIGTASKLTKVLADALTKIDNSDLSANDKKVLKTKARIVAQRYLKQHSNSKHIDDKYMIDLGKKINRELYGKTSSLSEFKKMTKELEAKAKEKGNQEAAAKGAANLGKKAITREIPDKEGVKELGKSVGDLVTSIPRAAYHGTSIAAKKAAEKLPKAEPKLEPVKAKA